MTAPLKQSTALQCLLLALAYLVTGKLGLLLAIPPGFATAIFPPAGIALAALLLYGNRLWPGVLLGSTCMNMLISLEAGAPFAFNTVTIALAIGGGATLQALAGAALIRRFVGMPCALNSTREVLLFLGLGGPLSCLINSSFGPGVLWTAGIISGHEFIYSVWTWWVGDSIGVLLATPLMFIALAKPRHSWSARRYTVALPLLVTSLLVVVLFVRASAWEHDRLQLAFSNRADDITDQLELTLAQHLSILGSLARFYAGSELVERDEFRTFVRPLVEKHPGLHAITWTPRVRQAERTAFEASNQRIFPSYQIFERTREGRRVRASQRLDFFPVQYIEPLSGNELAIGFDTASNRVALEAQNHARYSGTATATAPLTLAQEHGTQQGVVIYLPVYAKGADLDEPAARSEQLIGFVSLVFRMGDLLQQVLASDLTQHINLRITDITGLDSQPLFEHVADAQPLHQVSWEKTLGIAGRQWLFSYTGSPAVNGAQTWLAWLVLAAGLLFTALLGAFLLIVTGHTAKVEELVEQRTDALAQANQATHRSNDILSAISRAQAAFIASPDTRLLFDGILSDLLALTGSEYGFIGEVLYKADDTPYLKTCAITNIAWNDETRKFYDDNAPGGMEFTNLKTLFGHVMTSGEAVIANMPKTDPRRGGLPPGHPPLNAFLGLPFSKGERMVGMVGIANRPEGYDQELIDYLQPLLNTLANLIDAQRIDRLRSVADKALRESESRLRSIFDNAIEAIITFDTRGSILSINPAGEILFGYPATDLINQPWHRLLPIAAQREFQDAFSRYLESGSDELIGSTREMEGVRADGRLFPIEVAISAVNTDTGLLFTAIVHDLTERQRVDRMKQEFIATVSHELRTPLTSILGNLGLIQGGAVGSLPDNLRPLIDSAHRNSNRLLRLINNILDIEKIEAGEFSLNMRNQPLLPLLIQALDGSRGYADSYGVNLQLEHPSLTGCWAQLDGERFIQVLNNIISNAIKFSPRGETVGVRLSCQDGQATIAISDQGPGIPEAFRERVFDKFAQADGSDSRQHTGSGLGLNISRALIEKMHGRISFQCPSEGGTLFLISLPSTAADAGARARNA